MTATAKACEAASKAVEATIVCDIVKTALLVNKRQYAKVMMLQRSVAVAAMLFDSGSAAVVVVLCDFCALLLMLVKK
jgi:hypothetical protein